MIEVKVYEVHNETRITGHEDGWATHEYTGKTTIVAAVTKHSDNMAIEWYIPKSEYVFMNLEKGVHEEDAVRGLFYDNQRHALK